MRVIRVRHNLWLSPRYGFRVGRLEVTADSRDRTMWVIWFRRRTTNWVWGFRYGPLPKYLKRIYRQVEADNRRRAMTGGVDQVTWPKPGWPPEGIPSANECIEKMLEYYCSWLNEWCKDSGMEDSLYEPKSFYQRRILAAYETYYWVVVADIYDGDEGGTSVITGYFFIPLYLDAEPEMRYMTQEFDTNVQVILDDGKPAATPKERG